MKVIEIAQKRDSHVGKRACTFVRAGRSFAVDLPRIRPYLLGPVPSST
jgi:hypothetical protein